MNDLILVPDELEFDNPYPDWRGYEREGVWVMQPEPRIVDGVEWWAVAGGNGDEWIRFMPGPNGNPHIIASWGEDKYGYPETSPTDEQWDEDPKWRPCWPEVIRTLEYTEYDVDYGEEYDTFEEAVRVGLEHAELVREADLARRGFR